MTGHQRCANAFKGIPSDKIPIMFHNFMLAAREAGISMREYRDEPKKAAESHIRFVEKYQTDGIMIDMDTVTLAGAVGVPIDFPEDQPARCHIPLLNTLEKVQDLKLVRISDYKYVNNLLEINRLLKDYFGDEIYIRGNCDQLPFSLASMMRTPSEWMMDLLINEELSFQLLDYCLDAAAQLIVLMKEVGVDMLSNGDSPAGPEMISPDMYVKYAMPYEKKIADLSRDLGLPYALHICGNTDVILDAMLETGSDAFELDYKTDIQKAQDMFKGKAVFIGNIDPSGVIANGTPELVEQKTRELLEIFRDNPRFILNAGCAIPPTTPEENIRRMVKVAREFTR